MQLNTNVHSASLKIFERTANVERYLIEVRKTKTLTKEEEREIFKKYQTASPLEREILTDKIVRGHQRFIISIAKKFSNNDNLLDIINEANIGLMTAIPLYKLDRESCFLAFAVYYIRREIDTYKKNKECTVRNITKNYVYHKANRVYDDLYSRLEREPTKEEFAKATQNNRLKTKRGIQSYENITYTHIDSDFNSNSEDKSYANIEFETVTSSQNDIEKKINKEDNLSKALHLLSTLSDRDREIVMKLYGVGYDHEYYVEDLAHTYGLTPERIRQIKTGAIASLQKKVKK